MSQEISVVQETLEAEEHPETLEETLIKQVTIMTFKTIGAGVLGAFMAITFSTVGLAEGSTEAEVVKVQEQQVLEQRPDADWLDKGWSSVKSITKAGAENSKKLWDSFRNVDDEYRVLRDKYRLLLASNQNLREQLASKEVAEAVKHSQVLQCSAEVYSYLSEMDMVKEAPVKEINIDKPQEVEDGKPD